MKITWTSLKGVCLLLLGLATTGGGRCFAADINTVTFATLADSSSATTPTTPPASPFKDESAATPVRIAPVEPAMPAGSPAYDTGIATCNNDCFQGAPGRVWFRGEYLNWWTSGTHLPPMVSTLNYPTNTVTSTVFGNDDILSGTHEGYRMDFGMWLDCQHRWGLEADYFDVTSRPDSYDSGLTNGFSNGTPNPIVRGFYDPTIPGSYVVGVGYPNLVAGRITVDATDYFQSAGLWLRYQLRASEWSTSNCDVNWTDPSARTFRLDAIAGYRFARLMDSVDEQDGAVDVSGTGTNGDVYSDINTYRTVNNFNGADLGFNAVYTIGRWSVDIVGKTAIGVNNQYASIYYSQVTDGSNTGTGITTNTASPQLSRNVFSAIPQLTVTGGYQVTDHLKVTAGYDLLYWTNVVRAADQIAVGPNGYPIGSATFAVSAQPPTGNTSNFLAQGLHLGAELRF